MTVEAAYERLWPIVRAKCARMMADDSEAQDVAQQTFERLWRAGLADGDARTVSAWIYKTSTRLALDRLRRKRIRQAYKPSVEQTVHPDAQVGARQALDRLAQTVPRRELEAVILSRVDGLTQPEVAEVLGISERTVRRHLASFDQRRASI